MSEPFISEIRMFGFNFAPRGWAFCDGQLLPIDQNTALFALVGTIYGGDGRTTLGLPNLQGRVPIHQGQGPGLTNRRLGQFGGQDTVPLQQSQMPSHSHAVNASSDEIGTPDPPADRYPAAPPATTGIKIYHTSQDGAMAKDALGNTGGSQAHNNVQPSTVVNFCIALTGLFPSRG